MITRLMLVSVFLLVISAPSRADIFAFKDLDGFEKCLRQNHLVESAKSGDKKQSRYLNKAEVEHRCFQNATKRLSKEKNPKVVTEWVDLASKHSHRSNAIDLLKILAGLDRKKCNDPIIYDTLLDIFSGPMSEDKKSFYQRAKAVTRVCLKDPTFKTDFMDEQDSTPGSYRYKAVCEVLLSEKLIKACKKG